MPTLEFPKDSYIYTARGLPVVPEFTLVSVFRAGEGTKYSWQNSHTAPDGRIESTVVHFNTSWWTLSTWKDARANTSSHLGISIGGKIAPQERSTEGDILVIRGGLRGVDVYVNGNLRAHSDTPAVPSNLGGYMGNATGGTIQVAETIAYGRPLSDDELNTLHRYLAGRYSLKLNPPVNWFNADVVRELREVSNTSATTGYKFSGNLARDAATGLPIVVQGGPLDTRLTVPFAGDRVGLRFDNEHFTFNELSYVSGLENGTSWSSQDAASQTEYTATSVVRLDNDGMPHTIEAIENPLHSAQDARYLYLEVDCIQGTVGFLNTRLGNTRVSLPKVVSCGKPFVVSMRGSQSSGTTDLFVNGKLALTHASFDKALRLFVGGRSGRYMRGLVADMQFHVNKLSDRDVAALHAQLGAKYQIATANSGEESGGASGPGEVAALGRPTYGQWVNLPQGKYMLSYYRRYAPTEDGVFVYPEVKSSDGEVLALPSEGRGYSDEDRWLAPGWHRLWNTFDVDVAGDYFVSFVVRHTPYSALAEGFLFAAPQLERVDSALTVAPAAFFPTDDDFVAPIGICDDKTGKKFRDGYWGVGCEYYCPSTLGVECARIAADPSGLPKRCFHELKFDLSQDEIESGKLLSQAGFARGNFNYRFEDIAVNVVGTAIKDCEYSETPSSCYAANFIQYSLVHEGPFLVRNYLGEDYEAPLYSGRVQQGKALLAERYLTNPLSSADNSLLQRYWDTELVGRPLSGRYTLRIFDTPETNWDALEDVQLVVNYRYWTRAK